MSGTDIAFAALVLTAIGTLIVVLKIIINAGKDKQKFESTIATVEDHKKVFAAFSELKTKVEEHSTILKSVVTEEDHVNMQKACRLEVEQIISNRLNQEMKEIRLHNDEIFNDIYEQITVMNSNLCHLMGAMQVEPIRSPKRRRKTDASRDFEVG